MLQKLPHDHDEPQVAKEARRRRVSRPKPGEDAKGSREDIAHELDLMIALLRGSVVVVPLIYTDGVDPEHHLPPWLCAAQISQRLEAVLSYWQGAAAVDEYLITWARLAPYVREGLVVYVICQGGFM